MYPFQLVPRSERDFHDRYLSRETEVSLPAFFRAGLKFTEVTAPDKHLQSLSAIPDEWIARHPFAVSLRGLTGTHTKIEFGVACQPRNRYKWRNGSRERNQFAESPYARSGRRLVHRLSRWYTNGEQPLLRVDCPDDSGQVFLDGPDVSGAHLRFTGRGNLGRKVTNRLPG